MPTSRPTSPGATISSSDALATKLKNAWLVDAFSIFTAKDVTLTGPDLYYNSAVTHLNPTETTASPLGKQLVGTGSDCATANQSQGNAIATIQAYPFSLGGIFCFTGTKTASSGPEAIVSLGDGATGSGAVFAILYIEDGTQGGTNGTICALVRTVSGGGIRLIQGPAFTSATAQACSLHVDSATVSAMHVDGTKYTGGTNNDAFGAGYFKTATMLGRANYSGSASYDFFGSSKLGVAFQWTSINAGVDDTVCLNWTADPWTVLTPDAGATAVTWGSHPTSGAVNVSSTNITIGVNATPITGTLVVTPHSDKAGAFSPSTVSLTTGSPSATVTFLPTVSGAHTISSTNNGGLTNPATYTYTVQPEVTVTLVTSPTDATARASLSSLHWAWFDQTDPASFAAPTDKGSTETTDGSGVMTIPLPNSTKVSGQTGWLVVSNSDGTVTQSPSGKTGGGPATVT